MRKKISKIIREQTEQKLRSYIHKWVYERGYFFYPSKFPRDYEPYDVERSPEDDNELYQMVVDAGDNDINIFHLAMDILEDAIEDGVQFKFI